MATTNKYINILRQFKQQHGSEYGIKRIGILALLPAVRIRKIAI